MDKEVKKVARELLGMKDSKSDMFGRIYEMNLLNRYRHFTRIYDKYPDGLRILFEADLLVRRIERRRMFNVIRNQRKELFRRDEK